MVECLLDITEFKLPMTITCTRDLIVTKHIFVDVMRRPSCTGYSFIQLVIKKQHKDRS